MQMYDYFLGWYAWELIYYKAVRREEKAEAKAEAKAKAKVVLGSWRKDCMWHT